ncbi:MAG TPA: hypothetical protein VMA73_07235 [Streptosporangiaceae bacterium]|nr:hypothetical protein [Streptosporangiaceae bacterium]
MRRIGQSVALFRISFRVLREHRGLIAFALVSPLITTMPAHPGGHNMDRGR